MSLSRRLLIVVFGLTLTLPALGSWPLADAQGRELPSLAPLLEEVSPSVVNISTHATRTVQNPLMNDPFFRHFFRGMPEGGRPQQRRTQSAGSGVIIDAKGVVVTNYHVVRGADEIHVGLADGRSYKAELVGSDAEVDIAVLKIEAQGLSALNIADSDAVRVGDFVIAIGNPFGLGQTVTTGVVSALGRSGLGIEGYENFIQTDASINPGNSGGALVNLRGELVGINTAIIAPAGGNIGIGFAIPANMARSSIDQIVEFGEVKRGQLGVIIQDLTPDLAEAFGMDRNQRGVVVAEVQEGSAAARAEVKAGDVITRVDDKAVASAAELRNEIGLRRIGDTVSLSLLRDGRARTLKAKIAEPIQIARTEDVHRFLEGATLQDHEDGRGVIVVEVASGSPAARAGLRARDVIIQANRDRVRNLQDLQSAVKSPDERLLLRIQRGNAALFLVLQ